VELDGAVEGLGPPERAARALRYLQRTERSWLLVLDNVATPAQLSACCPSTGNGRVLVTSRQRGFGDFGPAFRVGVLDLQAAEEYLVEWAGRPDDRAGARRLAAALGCLPLALSHAGSYCSAGTSFADYLELLEALPAAEVFDTNPEAFYEQTVASTREASMREAGAKAALAAPMLAMAAYLAPDAIPPSLFAVLVEGDGPRQHKALADALNALHRFSLLDLGDGSASIHRLVQKTVRDGAEARHDWTGHLAALEALSGAFPEDTAIPGWWPQCEQLLPHVLALGQAPLPSGGVVADVRPRGKRRSQVPSAPRRLVKLLNRACVYMLQAGGGERAVGGARITAGLAERLLGPEHPDTLTARNNLAASYWSAGRIPDAIAILERVVAESKRLLGPEHPDTLTARHNLAGSYWLAGRIPDAIAILERVVGDRERRLGPEHPDTLKARIDLAASYWSVGRTGDPIAIQERVAADCERLLGPEHPYTLKARGSLALFYQSAGRTADAIAILERVLGDPKRLLGPEHPDTLTARNKLAGSHWLGGRTADAIAILEGVVSDRERLLGPEHADTLMARNNLAGSYWLGGRTADAIAIEERVVADRERLLGPGHPNTLTARQLLVRWKGGQT
jgi:tetratricopeptide (TPR) repeat protein